MPKSEYYLKSEMRESKVMTLLSEKRTILSEIRTWVTMFLLPLSILTVILGISKFYDVSKLLEIIIIVLVICFLLLIILAYYLSKSLLKLFEFNKRIKRYDGKF